MSAPEKKTPQSESRTDFGAVMQLMREMGSKSFDPLPPDQHKWTMSKDEAPMVRMWGWMCAHTVHFRHRSPFAVNDQSQELHLEHAAADLDMDPGNMRRTWRTGVSRGLWRNGTEEEGKRKLYLCGKVKPQPLQAGESSEDQMVDPTEEGEEKAKEVSADLFKPYLAKQINKLTSTERSAFLEAHLEDTLLFKRAHAELTEGLRTIFDKKEDIRFQRFGIHKIREEHRKRETPEEIQARQARLDLVLPEVERFVQTVDASVQSQKETLHKPESPSVQSAGATVPLSGSEAQIKPRTSSECSSPDASPQSVKTPPMNARKPDGQPESRCLRSAAPLP
jgi:hypothetical protein